MAASMTTCQSSVSYSHKYWRAVFTFDWRCARMTSRGRHVFHGLGKLRVSREVCRALFVSFPPTVNNAILRSAGFGYENVV